MDALIGKQDLVLTDNIEDYPSGIILPIDKPYRWTSADVIRKIKYAACRHFHRKNLKVGHAGTLDPLATGVLLVCLGKATKLAQELQGHPKQYLAGISFGASTPSYDREKDIDCRYSLEGVSEEALNKVIPEFIGEQEQVAPLFSAKSVDGVRAYEMARKEYKASRKEGTAFDHSAELELSTQKINISSLKVLSFLPDGIPEGTPTNADEHCHINVIDLSAEKLPHAEVLVDCSKGTYIRALARDLGEALGSGAFLDALRRTRTGKFCIEEALSVEEALSLLR